MKDKIIYIVIIVLLSLLIVSNLINITKSIVGNTRNTNDIPLNKYNKVNDIVVDIHGMAKEAIGLITTLINLDMYDSLYDKYLDEIYKNEKFPNKEDFKKKFEDVKKGEAINLSYKISDIKNNKRQYIFSYNVTYMSSLPVTSEHAESVPGSINEHWIITTTANKDYKLTIK